MTSSICCVCAGSQAAWMPTRPLEAKQSEKARHCVAQPCWFSTRVYSRLCMPLPGPPEEKEEPPPSRWVSTTIVAAPCTSRQPPAYSNARMMLASGAVPAGRRGQV